MAVAHSAPILLRTKLHKPLLQLDLVLRTQLLQKLHFGLGLAHSPGFPHGPARKLTLVAAPAGFGKTTLVASWLALLESEAAQGLHGWGRSCWLSLDPLDNNLGRFLTYVAAAVRAAYPDACSNFTRILQLLPLPQLDHLCELLLNDLAELEGNLVFVFDDYQQVQNHDVQQVIETLIVHAPPNLHLVLATRLDPPLPLSRLRVQKQITEVRAAELRFSVDEAGVFFARALGTPLAADTVQSLDERAEGWVAGLRLAAISLQDGADPVALACAFRGTHHHILDFLLEQVMAQQPPCVAEFLACTAPLQMLSAPLCSEVLDSIAIPRAESNDPFVIQGRTPDAPLRIDSRAVLEYLDRANLFVVRLDNTRHWYRYHHLFRDMLLYWLQTRHTPDEIEAINRRAANWYARNGHVDAAVGQLLSAGAPNEAADLVEVSLPLMLGRVPWPAVQQLLATLPDGLVGERPILMLARAWFMWVIQRHDLLPNMLHQAETLLAKAELNHGEPRPVWLQGWIDALWSLVHMLAWDCDQALLRGENAIAHLPAAYGHARGVTIVHYLLVQQHQGRRNEALAYYAHVVANEPDESMQRVAIAPGLLAMYAGDLPGLSAAGEYILRLAPQASISKLHSFGHLCAGIAAYEQNKLPLAEQHFTAVYADRFGSATMLVFDAITGLALTHQAMGDPAGAQTWTTALIQHTGDFQSAYLTGVAHWLQCRLDLQGSSVALPPGGHQWCVGAATAIQYRWGELPELTYARLLIAQGTRAGIAEAVALLRTEVDRCTRYHLLWRQVEATALLALAFKAQGQLVVAQETLTRALELAQPMQLIRTFVDLGPAMASLLYSLTHKGPNVEYIGRLLMAFPLDSRNAVAVAAAEKLSDEIIEPLSEREIEVLGLLAERLSDKEIAERLRISPLTVRRHSVNLYQKLHVNSRRQAVSRAQALGLLSAS